MRIWYGSQHLPFNILALSPLLSSPATFTASGQVVRYPDIRSGKICHDGEPGGMFGWAVDVADHPASNKTFMAVGKPWDGEVHIYSVDTPPREIKTTTELRTVTECPTSTTVSASSTITVTATTDCAETTTTTTSLVFPPVPTDLAWSRSTVLRDLWNESSTYNWNGGPDGTAYSLFGYSVNFSPNASLLAIGIPGRTYEHSQDVRNLEHHEYHGAARVYRLVEDDWLEFGEELRRDPAPAFWDRFGSKVLWDPAGINLFVTSNGGWDGASNPEFRVRFTNSSDWPSLPTTDVRTLGVHVFAVNSTTNTMGYRHFIDAKSPVPFGQSGIDISASAHNGESVLAMRDHDGGQGLVVMYKFDRDSETFVEVSKVKRYLRDIGSYPEDWFGLGVAISHDLSGRLFLVTAAPKLPLKLYGYTQEKKEEPALLKSTEVPNPEIESPRSFFGGVLRQASNDALILASDSTSSSGTGAVRIFLKREPGLFVKDFEEVVIRTDSAQESVTYDYIGLLDRPDESVPSAFEMDQFGKDIGVGEWAVVVGSPLKECVYTYWKPVTYSPVGFKLRQDLPNVTITPDDPLAGAYSQDSAVLYSSIGAGVALVLMLPLTWGVAMKLHKARVLASLAETSKAS